MNLPELLGAGNTVRAVKPVYENPDADSAASGDAFLSSMNSLTQDPDPPKGGLGQQTGDEQPEASTTEGVSTEPQSKSETPASDTQSVSTVSASAVTLQSKPMTPEVFALLAQRAPVLAGAPAQPKASSEASPIQANGAPAPAIAGLTSGQPSTQIGSTPESLPTEAISVKGEGISKDPTKVTLDANTNRPVSNNNGIATQQLPTQPSGLDQRANSMATIAPISQQQMGRSREPSRVSVQSQSTEPLSSGKLLETPRTGAQKTPEEKVDTRAEQRPVHDAVVEEKMDDKRLVERREDNAAADLKRQDRSAPVQQSGTSNVPAHARIGAPAATVVEFGQVSTNSQAATNVTSSLVPRDAVADRGAIPNATPAAASEASTRNTVSQITAAIRNQPLMQMIELSLDPPELGRIEIQMEVAELGLKATLSAERSGTSELIRRQAELLQQQLNDAGFADVDLEFSEFGSGKDDKSNGETTFSHNRSGDFSGQSTEAAPELTRRMHFDSSGMDVRL